jgi:hypothetical protein
MLVAAHTDHADLIEPKAIEPDDFIFLGPVQGHDAVQLCAAGQDPRLQFKAFLKLAQVGAVSGCYQGDLRKGSFYEGGQEPEVVTVNDIRLEISDGFGQTVRKAFFIDCQVRRAQIRKPPAGIGHDIAHAHHRKGQPAGFEPDEGTLIVGQSL